MDINFSNFSVDENGRTSFSGVSSSIDFQGIVNQIMAAKRLPIDRINSEISLNSAKISSFNALDGLFQDLRTALDGLRGKIAFGGKGDIFQAKAAFASTSLSGSSLFRPSALSATDANLLVGITVDNSADAGTRTVEIIRTAKAQKVSSQALSSDIDPLGFSGEFGINGATINVSAGQSLRDIKDAINNATFDDDGDPETPQVSAGVRASIVSASDTEHFLVITSEETGKPISFDDSATDQLLLNDLGILDGSMGGGPLVSAAVTDTTADLGLTGTIEVMDTEIDLTGLSLDDLQTQINAIGGVNATINGSNQLEIDAPGDDLVIFDPDGQLDQLGFNLGSVQYEDVLQAAETALYTLDNISDPTRFRSDLIYSASATLGDLTSGTLAAGTFDVDIDGVTSGPLSVAYDPSDDINTVVANINAAIQADTGGSETYARVENQGARGVRIVIEGGDNEVTLSNDSGDAEGFLATFNFNDTRIFESDTNLFTDNGVTFDFFQAEPGTVIEIDIEPDLNEVKLGLQEFVIAYNEIINFMNEQGEAPESEDGLADTLVGPLFQDSTVRDLRLRISSLLTENVEGIEEGFQTLGLIGIDFGPDGRLDVDEEELDENLINNLEQLREYFAFDATLDNANFTVLGFDGDMTYLPAGVDINFEADADGNILSADIGGDSTLVEIDGNEIRVVGGPAEGLVVSYSGGADVGTLNVNYSVGKAASMFEEIDRILETDGVLDQRVNELQDINEAKERDVERRSLLLEEERTRLLNQFLTMERNLAELESLRQSVTGAFEALNQDR